MSARACRLLLVVCAACLAKAAPASAQVYAEELRVTGAWPDIELAAGGGFGLDRALDDPLTARIRLGALYAYEPWIASLGASAVLGGLARRGLGVELEVDHFAGGFVVLAVSRARGDAWSMRAALGWTLLAVEWQHRFDSTAADAALLLLRVPLGKWWFLLAHDDPPAQTRGKGRNPSQKRATNDVRR